MKWLELQHFRINVVQKIMATSMVFSSEGQEQRAGPDHNLA